MKLTHNPSVIILSLLLAFASAAVADSCLVNIVSNVREGTSGTTHTATYDLAQYYVFNDGRAPQLVQRISGTGYTNDAPGTSASRTLYAAKVQWMRWAQGAYTIPESNRPSWLPVSDKKLEPTTSTTYGIWWLKVSTSGNTPTNPPTATNLIYTSTLESAVWYAIRQTKALNTFKWTDLLALPSKSVREIFTNLSELAMKKTGLSQLRDMLEDVGYEMASLSDMKRLLKSPLKADKDRAAWQLRGSAESVRTLRWKLGGAYGANFSPGTSIGMIKQLDDFVIDYEITLRAAEGYWTMNPPTWITYSYGRPAFIDFPSDTARVIQIDDHEFPRVKVVYTDIYLIVEPDHDPNTQIFKVENTGRRYRMTYISTTPPKKVRFEIENVIWIPQSTLTGVVMVPLLWWVPCSNPLN